MRAIDKTDVEAFFADKTNGVRRYNTEEFVLREAEEKLFHLGAGTALLDFGCGTADLLAHYAGHFTRVYGADISENMLGHARRRLAEFGVSNAVLMRADDIAIWQDLTAEPLDAITTAAVMQYLTTDQIAEFVRSGVSRLKDNGRFVFFDIVDPNLYWLFRFNIYSADRSIFRNTFRGLQTFAKVTVKTILARLKGKAYDFNSHLGNTHLPGDIAALAQRNGLDCRIVRSMYYEYRYHAILTKPSRAG